LEAEAQAKVKHGTQSNMKEGLTVRYDVFGDDKKKAKLNTPEYTDSSRLIKPFEKLRASQRPQ
jgi:hypothetical protein